MPLVVRMIKRKLDGGEESWLAYHLGDDALGSWLFHPEGTLYAGRWADGREIACYSGVPEEPGCPILYFMPHEGGWVAQWRYTPWRGVTVDLSRPVQRDGGVWSFLDLELDLWHTPDEAPDPSDPRPQISRHGRTVGFADDDELEDAVAASLLDEDEASRTRAEAQQVAASMLHAVGPFASSTWERFDHAIAKKLPPPAAATDS